MVASGRFIIIVSGKNHIMYDVQLDQWVELEDRTQSIPNSFKHRVQIGGLCLPLQSYSSEEAKEANLEDRHFEMVWYGGISLTTDAYHVSLDVEYGQYDKGVDRAYLTFKPLISKVTNEEEFLRVPDRFFYNQVFYLHKRKVNFVEKNRYIGIVGREAFHVFDTELMQFSTEEVDDLYSTNSGYGTLV